MSAQNLILIVIDCMRSDQVGNRAERAFATPIIDQLAAAGTVFEQAVAAGFHTLTAMPTVLSGCYPSTFGGFRHFSDRRPRLPQVLKHLGYHTAAFVPNPYLSELRGYKAGFDHFDECRPGFSTRDKTWRAIPVKAINRLLGRFGAGIECPPYMNAQVVTDRAVDWLKQTSDPFFLWLHYMDAHTPYNLQRCSLLLPNGKGQRPYPFGFWRHLAGDNERVTPEERRLARQLYQNGIQFIDGQLGRLIGLLRDSGRLENTTFVLLGDHGEEFFEHGAFGHSNNLYEETIHVPLIIASGLNRPPRRISAQVRQLDLAPTLIDMAGGTPPSEMQGISLAPYLQGETTPNPLPAISQTNPAKNWLVSLRDFPWKLIWRIDPVTLKSHHYELYNLTDDPHETKNLSTDYPERTARMLDILKQHIAGLDFSDFNGQIIEEDPTIVDRLRDLGYLDNH